MFDAGADGPAAGGGEDGSLAAAWEAVAHQWIAWARAPGHDAYDRFHRDALFRLLPQPGSRTLDLGCGEGRVGRDLRAAGHRVTGLDRSPTLAAAAHDHPDPSPVVLGDAGSLPFPDRTFHLVLAFMSLQDVDDPARALAEVARVLQAGGCSVVAVVHPLNGAGSFSGDRTDHRAPFTIEGSYLAARRYADEIERDGLSMRFTSMHWSLQQWSEMVEAAGLVIEAIREVGSPGPTDRWHRIPLFLHLRLRRSWLSLPRSSRTPRGVLRVAS